MAATPLFSCPLCRATMPTRAGYCFHLGNRLCEKRNQPSGGWPLRCDNCYMGFVTKMGKAYHDLKRHCSRDGGHGILSSSSPLTRPLLPLSLLPPPTADYGPDFITNISSLEAVISSAYLINNAESQAMLITTSIPPFALQNSSATPATNSQVQDPTANMPLSFSAPQTMVSFIVGSNGVKFSTFKNLACFHSPFFNGAFNGPFVEGQSQEIKFEDVGVEEFGQLVHWMCCGKIEIDKVGLLTAAKLWCIADRFMIPVLQNVAVKHISVLLALLEIPENENLANNVGKVFQVAYEYGADTELKAILVEFVAGRFDINSIKSWAEYFPKEFLVDITVALKVHGQPLGGCFGWKLAVENFLVPV